MLHRVVRCWIVARVLHQVSRGRNANKKSISSSKNSIPIRFAKLKKIYINTKRPPEQWRSSIHFRASNWSLCVEASSTHFLVDARVTWWINLEWLTDGLMNKSFFKGIQTSRCVLKCHVIKVNREDIYLTSIPGILSGRFTDPLWNNGKPIINAQTNADSINT